MFLFLCCRLALGTDETLTVQLTEQPESVELTVVRKECVFPELRKSLVYLISTCRQCNYALRNSRTDKSVTRA